MRFSIAGNPDSLLLETAQRMEVESDRLQRILKGQHLDSCVPAIYQAAGQEATLGRWGDRVSIHKSLSCTTNRGDVVQDWS